VISGPPAAVLTVPMQALAGRRAGWLAGRPVMRCAAYKDDSEPLARLSTPAVSADTHKVSGDFTFKVGE
jgi:hypothetical protein